MALLAKDSNIPQFMPSLVHMAAVRVVIDSFLDLLFDLKTLCKVYADMQQGNSVSFKKGSRERERNGRKAKRAREKLLCIPKHLRHTVYTVINGMAYDSDTCFLNNITDGVRDGAKEIDCFIRSDGTTDRIKTAQSFVVNENVNIRQRFRVACLHCFEENIVSLWKKMEACGETQNFDTNNKLMTNFWVKWILDGSSIPWLQALKEYIISAPELLDEDRLLVRPFFRLLQPEEREEFLIYLTMSGDYDDFRFCLYSATKEEEAKILENEPAPFLAYHLHWPLQSLFLEVADMVWHFLDVSSFTNVLMFIWYLGQKRNDFDYSQLFLDFWNRSPISLKAAVEENPTNSEKINSILNRITNKRKWIRENGRLERTA